MTEYQLILDILPIGVFNSISSTIVVEYVLTLALWIIVQRS